MKARTTVFCAVWNGDDQRHELLRGHMDTLARQTTPVETVYVFDNDDPPPPWLRGRAVRSRDPLTIYQAWNVALQYAGTEYVMNLNLDDRLAPDAVETMQEFADANQAGLVGADWQIRFTQADTDQVKEVFRASQLAFDPGWPPTPGFEGRLGSGTGERGTFGPATLWRRDLHERAPYPWQFASGEPIRSVGDLAWWMMVGNYLESTVVRLPWVVGNYHSHPEGQAEFRAADEHGVLAGQGVHLGWYPLDNVTVEKE